jgi:hypothetical protein
MKMLFPRCELAEVKSVGRKLARAGVKCELRKNPVAQGLFGIAPFPELWIEDEKDIPKALKLLGARRLRKMTVIFSQPEAAGTKER